MVSARSVEWEFDRAMFRSSVTEFQLRVFGHDSATHFHLVCVTVPILEHRPPELGKGEMGRRDGGQVGLASDDATRISELFEYLETCGFSGGVKLAIRIAFAIRIATQTSTRMLGRDLVFCC